MRVAIHYLKGASPHRQLEQVRMLLVVEEVFMF